MKSHPFFYGVDWPTIRQIDAPFVPHLRSITDTSYFPTDELEQVPEEPAGAENSGANKDLAFLGWVIRFHSWSSFLISSILGIPSSGLLGPIRLARWINAPTTGLELINENIIRNHHVRMRTTLLSAHLKSGLLGTV